ncbi:Uncharacterised protein [Shigella flexneri]|nr:Uncharacterised protein [Shigella flexneri]
MMHAHPHADARAGFKSANKYTAFFQQRLSGGGSLAPIIANHRHRKQPYQPNNDHGEDRA